MGPADMMQITKIKDDYPIGYVRWTERRNFEAILDMMSEGALDTAQLTTHTFKFNDAAQAYDTLLNSKIL